MNLHTYRAKSLPEAIALVRRHLGPEAEVVHAREVPAGLLGWRGKAVEVTAAEYLEEAVNGAGPEKASLEVPVRENLQPPAAPLREELLRGLQVLDRGEPSLVEQLTRETITEEPWRSLLRELEQRGLPQPMAREIVEALLLRGERPRRGLAPAADVLADRIAIRSLGEVLAVTDSPRRGPRIVAVLGESEAGKSSVIAKIAIRLAERTRACVGLASWSDGEPGDLTPLAKVAAAYGLPFRHGHNPRQWEAVLEQLAGCDLLLLEIETGLALGRGETGFAQSLLERGVAGERLVLLPAGPEPPRGIAPPLQAWRPTAAVLTQLDRAATPAQLAPHLLAASPSVPVAALSTGPRLTADFEAATAARVSAWLLGLTAAAVPVEEGEK